MNQKRKRIWALFLSVVLSIIQLPVVARAENVAPKDREIASFESLDNGVAKQTVDTGTELAELNLPDTVTATIYRVTEDIVISNENNEEESKDTSITMPNEIDESVLDNNTEDFSQQDSGKTVTTVTTSKEKILVTWDSEPVYDGNAEGSYVFTADVGGYVLSDNAKLPQIIVGVTEKTIEKLSENPTKNPIENPTENPIENSTKNPIENPIENPTENPTKNPIEDPTENPIENPIEDPTENPIENPTKNPIEDPTENPTEQNNTLVKNITNWTFVDDENLTKGELALSGVNLDNQADFNRVVSMLPTQISAEIEEKTDPYILDITDWDCPEYRKNDEGSWPLTGEYTFTAALPEGYACDSLPTVKVLLGGVHNYIDFYYTEMYGIRVTVVNSGDIEYNEGSGFTLKTNGTYRISGEWTGTGKLNKENAVITVPGNVTADVILSNAIIESKEDETCAFAIEANGTANITLVGTNILTSGHSCAGLEVPKDAAVTITGKGSLKVTGGASAAGIGGSNGHINLYDSNAGRITINGGIVETIAGVKGAGIGGGYNGNGGIIEINDGEIIATGNEGAGIGGGNNGNGGIIKISGGTVIAGGSKGAGIGGGNNGNGGTIEISGGMVTATGGSSPDIIGGGAGIGGGGYNGNGGTIKISGGTVIATGGGSGGISGGAGIGGGGGGGAGIGGSGDNITITGGIVKAIGSITGAGIGGGGNDRVDFKSEAGSIEINGNTIVFASAQKGANIGSGGNTYSQNTESGSFIQGLVFKGEQGIVHGSTALFDDMTILQDHTLTVLDNSTLTIPDGTTLINNGTIENKGKINGSGTITNNGTINDYSNGIAVKVNGNEIKKPAETAILFWKDGQELTNSKAIVGDTIEIQAKVAQKNTRLLKATPDPDQIVFKTGNTVLGKADVINGIARLSLVLTEEVWKPGSYVIETEYGGGTGLIPNNSGSAVLVVDARSYKITANPTTLDFGSKIVDYADVPDVQTVTIENIGNSPISGYTISGNTIFDVTYASDTIPVGKSVSFTVQPHSGLATGTYHEILTITTAEDSSATTMIDVKFVVMDKTVYPVTVNGGTASPASAAEGAIVTITATVADNQQFNGWQISPDVIFTEGNKNTVTAKFIMPAQAVTAMADFTNKPPISIAVTEVTLDKSAQSLYVNQDITLTAMVKPDNATDKSVNWTSSNTKVAAVDANGKVTAHAVGTAVITATTNDGGKKAACTINVQEKPVISIAVTEVTLDKSAQSLYVNQDVTLTAVVKPDNATDKSVNWTSSNTKVAAVDASGKVTAHAVGTAVITATTNDGGKKADCTITVKTSTSSSGGGGGSYFPYEVQNSYTVTGDKINQTISRYNLKKLENSGKSLIIHCDKVGMNFDTAALKAILAAVPATANKVTFAAAPADLSAFPDAMALIGSYPVYNFTISYEDSKKNPVTVKVDFSASSASIFLNYVPTPRLVTENLFMVYVDDKGAVMWLAKSSYDNGKVLAEVPHFSVYGVAYKAPAPVLADKESESVFTDIVGHWAKADIEFVAARGLLSGTGNNLFSPNGTMTRGMFVTALGRLADVNAENYKTHSFTDVKPDTYYAAYVEWASQKNIVKGTGDKLFSPDEPVTREQMAVMMVNYAREMGYSIPAPLAEVAFADNNKISQWAAKEVIVMQQAGIIKGKEGNRFDPQGNATRAEVSAVLHQFVEIVIHSNTITR